jgi:protein-tyrosine phosphatase
VIDLHSHILAGLDDGAGDMRASIEIARAAVADGVHLMVATPHVNGHYMPDPATIRTAVAELNNALAAEGVALVVSPGAEIAVSELPRLDDGVLRQLSLGESNTLLIESPYVNAVPFLEQMLFDLQARGFRVILAHPERSPMLAKDRDLLGRLVDREILCSVTAGSLAGRFGRRVRAATLELIQHRLVHNVASDAHDTAQRPPGLTAGLEGAGKLLSGFEGLTRWLTEEVPTALLNSEAPAAYPEQVTIKPRSRALLRRRTA